LTNPICLQSWKYYEEEVYFAMKEVKKDRLGLAAGNYFLLIAALVIITAGYIIMGQNEISLSPILLVVAYVIIIPVALLIKFKPKN
jgi:hypothetical protein